MSVTTAGALSERFSSYHKIYIVQAGITVVGLIGEDASMAEQANWTSPFEGDGVGDKFNKVGGLLQDKTGTTTVTQLTSRQVWQGNAPISFDLSVRFIALDNPVNEVMRPLRLLSKVMAPELLEDSPIGYDSGSSEIPGSERGVKFGRVPGKVALRIGNKIIYPNCKIEAKAAPLTWSKDINGNFLRAEIQLTVQTASTVNRSEFDAMYPGS